MTRPRVIDAHVHFWDPRVLRYPWLDGLPALRRPFLPPDYPANAADAVVFVEANCAPREPLAEVQFAERLGQIVGMVAFVDLRDGHARDETLAQFAEHSSFLARQPRPPRLRRTTPPPT